MERCKNMGCCFAAHIQTHRHTYTHTSYIQKYHNSSSTHTFVPIQLVKVSHPRVQKVTATTTTTSSSLLQSSSNQNSHSHTFQQHQQCLRDVFF